MKISFRAVAAVVACLFITSAALAQNAGTVTNHAFAIGKGAGATGYTSMLCTSAQLAVGQAAADPICQTITGDVTISAGGVTAIGASKVTNSQLGTMAANTTKCNATAGTANPTDCNAATMRTNIGVVIGTNVEAWDADLDCIAANSTAGLLAYTGAGTCAYRTLTAPAAGFTITNPAGTAGNPIFVLANDLAALEGLSSTGIARRTGTDAWSVGTAVSNSELATMAAFTLKGNNTGSAATPTDVDISTLTAKASPASTDLVMISDQAAAGAWKKVTVSSLASAGAVASIGGLTGAVGLTASDLAVSGSNIQLSAARKTLSSGCAINSTSATTCADGSAGANNGTYTTPTGALWLEIEMIGPGGGGAGSGTSPGNGGAGANTTFGAGPLLSAPAGGGGIGAGGGGGGTPSGGFMNKTGGNGGSGSGANLTPGGAGCVSPYGGGGALGAAGAGAGGAAAANSGSGGGGAGVNATVNGGGGGGCGGFLRAIIQSPAATYSYAIGLGGTAGTAGTGGAAGGNGGSGFISVIPHFN